MNCACPGPMQLQHVSHAVPLAARAGHAAINSCRLPATKHAAAIDFAATAALAAAATVGDSTVKRQLEHLSTTVQSPATYHSPYFAVPVVHKDMPTSSKLSGRQARLLTRRITQCNNWQELQQLHETCSINIIHISAIMSRLGRLQQSAPQTLLQVPEFRSFLQQLEQTSLQLISAVQFQQGPSLQVWREIQQGVLVQEQHCVSSKQQLQAQPQQLCTLAWGWALLGHCPSAHWWSCYWTCSLPQLPLYSSQELATAVWSAARLQQHPPAPWIDAFECQSMTVMAKASPQELCMLFMGLVQLRLQPKAAWWAGLQDATLDLLSEIQPRDLAQVMWGHARLQALFPKPWLSQVLAAAQSLAPRFTGHDCAMLLWSLAALGQQADKQLLEQMLMCLHMSNCKLDACSVQDFAQILWAIAVFSSQSRAQACSELLGSGSRHYAGSSQSSTQGSCRSHSSSIKSSSESRDEQRPVHMHTHQQMPNSSSRCSTSRCSSSSCSTSSSHNSLYTMCSNTPTGGIDSSMHNISVSSSVIDQQLLSHWASVTWQYTKPQDVLLSPADATQLLWAATQLGQSCWPDAVWMQQYWAASKQWMFTYTAQAVTVTVWAGLKLGFGPPRSWLLAAVPVLQERLAELQPASACQLLYVLARLQHRPNPVFMEQLLSRLQLDSHQLQPRAFACVLWSLGCLGYQPGTNWWDNILHHLQQNVGHLGQRELQNVVFGLSMLQCDVPAGLRKTLVQHAQELHAQKLNAQGFGTKANGATAEAAPLESST